MIYRLFIALICTVFAFPAYALPRFPFPQHVNYGSDTIYPNHKMQSQIDHEVSIAYQKWKQNHLVQAGEESNGQPRYRVVLPDQRTVSEGQGYGMMIVAYMAGHDSDAQTIFDGLWEFFNDHRSINDPRLMDWSVPADESSDGAFDGSAFDGDCDIAFALLLAERQWGNDGRINYISEAKNMIAGILEKEIGPDSKLPMLGDWVNPYGSEYNQYTVRISDFMLDHFRAFGRVTGNSVWNEVVENCQSSLTHIAGNYSSSTGLQPDFIVPVSDTDHHPKPAEPDFLEGPNDGKYSYNSCRYPWRMGVDALINRDETSKEILGHLSSWVENAVGGDPVNIKAGYSLGGQPIGNYFTTVFVAPFGVAAMNKPSQQQWLNDIYDAVADKTENYYSDTVTLLSLLVMSRNYWNPTNHFDLQNAIIVLRILTGIESDQQIIADVDGNGKAGLEDVVYILQIIAEVRG